MSNGCPNCEALCAICQDNTYNWHEPLCSSCRLAVAHTEDRIIKLLEHITRVGTECLMCGNDCSAERLIAHIKGEK